MAFASVRTEIRLDRRLASEKLRRGSDGHFTAVSKQRAPVLGTHHRHRSRCGKCGVAEGKVSHVWARRCARAILRPAAAMDPAIVERGSVGRRKDFGTRKRAADLLDQSYARGWARS